MKAPRINVVKID